MIKKICYFGIFNPEYPRSQMLVKVFKLNGYEVIFCNIDPRQVRGMYKYINLYKKYREISKQNKFDYIVVGFPGYIAVLLARIMTTKPIIFDAFISYYDGIRDRQDYSWYHPKSLFAWTVDFLDGLVAKIVLTINIEYKKFFVETLKVSSNKVEVLHKGADESVLFPTKKKINNTNHFVIGWWGSFIPLHGISTIIESAKILKNRSDIKFEIIGSGQIEKQIKDQALKYGLTNVTFIPFLSRAELKQKIADFDLVLGIFSSLPKAMRCVTNKVYEAMAMGKAIITEDSGASREIFTQGVNVYLVSPANSQSLVDAIMKLTNDQDLRLKMGQNALQLFQERFTTEKIGLELKNILNSHEK